GADGADVALNALVGIEPVLRDHVRGDAAPEEVLLLGRELHRLLLGEIDRARHAGRHDVPGAPAGPAEAEPSRVAGQISRVAGADRERRGRGEERSREALHGFLPILPAITNASTSAESGFGPFAWRASSA